MTGTQILAAFESIGAVVTLTPAGIVDVQSPDVPEFERLCAEVKANRSEVVAELRRHAAPEHPCVTCGKEADVSTLYCPPCWDRRRDRGRLLSFDEDRLRRHEERQQRTAEALAGKFCEACGKSWWAVNARGDAWCVPCWRKARKNLATSPQDGRTVPRPARSIPPETTGQGGAA